MARAPAAAPPAARTTPSATVTLTAAPNNTASGANPGASRKVLGWLFALSVVAFAGFLIYDWIMSPSTTPTTPSISSAPRQPAIVPCTVPSKPLKLAYGEKYTPPRPDCAVGWLIPFESNVAEVSSDGRYLMYITPKPGKVIDGFVVSCEPGKWKAGTQLCN